MDIVYIDIAKAFDSVSHSKLISVLNSLGVSGNLLGVSGNTRIKMPEIHKSKMPFRT